MKKITKWDFIMLGEYLVIVTLGWLFLKNSHDLFTWVGTATGVWGYYLLDRVLGLEDILRTAALKAAAGLPPPK